MATDIELKSATIWATFRDSQGGVKTILAGVFVNRVSGFLNIFLVLYLTARGFSAAQASIALGAYGVGALAGVFVGGALADALGARNATVVSMLSTSALTASLLFLPSFPLLLAAAILLGLGGQLYRPASTTLLSVLTPQHRQIMVFAMYRFGLNLGATVAPLLGFALYNLGGQHYDLLFWGEALIAAGYAVLAAIALPARTPRRSRQTDQAQTTPPPQGLGGYGALMRDRRYLVFLVATLLHTAVYAQYLSTLPLDVIASGLPTLWYTLAVSLNGFVVVAFELPLTKITQRLPFVVTIGVAFALLGVGVAGYGLPIGPAVILAATLVWSLGEIIGGPAIFAYPAVIAPEHLKSRYIASFQLMFGLGTAVGPVVGVLLLRHLGHQAWPVLAVGSLLATVLVLFAVRQRPATATPPPAEPRTPLEPPAPAYAAAP